MKKLIGQRENGSLIHKQENRYGSLPKGAQPFQLKNGKRTLKMSPRMLMIVKAMKMKIVLCLTLKISSLNLIQKKRQTKILMMYLIKEKKILALL